MSSIGQFPTHNQRNTFAVDLPASIGQAIAAESLWGRETVYCDHSGTWLPAFIDCLIGAEESRRDCLA